MSSINVYNFEFSSKVSKEFLHLSFKKLEGIIRDNDEGSSSNLIITENGEKNHDLKIGDFSLENWDKFDEIKYIISGTNNPGGVYSFELSHNSKNTNKLIQMTVTDLNKSQTEIYENFKNYVL